MTRQRRIILDALESVRTHPTAEDIYRMVRPRLQRLSLATVYRNLEVLCEQGLARKIETAGTTRRYDGDASEHYHVRCLGCGAIGDVRKAPVSVSRTGLARATDFQIVGHRLEFLGYCPSCKGRRRRGARDAPARRRSGGGDV
jgi:Fur family ferric uptake transcriptional regulator